MAASTASRLRLPSAARSWACKYLWPRPRKMVFFGQHAMFVYGVNVEVFSDLPRGFSKISNSLSLLGQRSFVQFNCNCGRELVVYEPLNHIPFDVHNPVNSEIQFSAVELEQNSEQELELCQVCLSVGGCRGHHTNFCRQRVGCHVTVWA